MVIIMNRNVDDHFAKTPTPHFPRSLFNVGIKKRLQTQQHGRLYPFFARLVYPGDTWNMKLTTFCRADTSYRVPLDDIFLDTYFFFCPLRIIDKDFPKILGEGEPEDYDDVSYGFPTFHIESDVPDGYEATLTINNILGYLGYSQAQVNIDSVNHVFGFGADDEICPYPLMAYYKVYNDWFRDENLDASIPYGDLIGGYQSNFDIGGLWDHLSCLKINKFHDYFTSCMIAPQKGPAVTIPLGTSAPVVTSLNVSQGKSDIPLDWTILSDGSKLNFARGLSTAASGGTYSTNTSDPTGDPSVAPRNLVADLSAAAGTINELKLALSLQALYERRGTFGTRYIETIRGQWGIEVPDSFFLRPEYLGGSRVTLNNIPVLSTENSSQLGQMAGNSSTLANGGSFSKTFIEYGILLGVSCTRIKHSYMQGKRKELFSLKTQVDLYNPVFANIGPQPVYKNEIYNQGSAYDKVVFAYQEPWADLKSDFDSFAIFYF